eukprot:jgi/Mesen1/5823/ME000297S05025
MEDLTHGYHKACVMDIKMGRKTWYEGASEKYITKCIAKDAATTSGEVGFRVAGMQVYEPSSGSFWKADRVWCKKLASSAVPAALERYVSSRPSQDDAKADPALAKEVYGSILSQLKELREWFATQTTYQFYSSSLLLVYEGASEDGDGKALSRRPSLRLVDFAHVVENKGEVDANYLEAIDCVNTYLNNIVNGP